jgi:hypothetical protein
MRSQWDRECGAFKTPAIPERSCNSTSRRMKMVQTHPPSLRNLRIIRLASSLALGQTHTLSGKARLGRGDCSLSLSDGGGTSFEWRTETGGPSLPDANLFAVGRHCGIEEAGGGRSCSVSPLARLC